MIGLAVAAAVGLALAYLAVTPRQYGATATVLISSPSDAQGASTGVLSDASPASTVIDTQVALLRSEAVARRVAAAERLDLDPEFNGALPDGPPLDPAANPAPQTQPAWVVAALRSRLDVRRDGITALLTVSYRADSPERAAAIANAFAREYVNMQLEVRSDSTQQANAWLLDRLEVLRRDVEKAENEIAALEARRGLYSVSGATLAEAQVGQLSQQLSQARAELAEREARLASARAQTERGADMESLGEVINSPAITQLRTQQAQVLRERGELASTLGPLHPRLQKADEELRQIDAQISREATRILANIETEVEVSRRRVASLAGSLARWEGRLGEEGRSSVELRELERRANAARILYETFLQNFNATGAAAGAAATDIRIVSQAEPTPWAVWPNSKLVVGFAAVAGLLLGVGLAVIAEALRRGFRGATEIERALGLPVVGMLERVGSGVPRPAALLPAPIKALPPPPGAPARTSVEDFVLNAPNSSFSESLRALRNLFVGMRSERSCAVLLFTSAAPGEGKTSTTMAFARVAAMSGLRVLIIDADLRRCDLTRRLALEPKVDLGDVISGEATLADALLPDAQSGAKVLPCIIGRDWHNRNAFMSDGFAQLLDDARKDYDLVVIDSAPVTALSDVLNLSRKADGVVLLVRWDKTPRVIVEHAVEQLRRVGAVFKGVLLTRVPTSDMAYQGYYYGY